MSKRLDSVKVRPGKKPRPAVPASDHLLHRDQQHRTRLMWLSVSAMMVIIVLGWFSLQRIRRQEAHGNGPFDKIVDQLSALFSGENNSGNNGTGRAGEDEHLEELQDQVFPEFQDVVR